MRVYRVENWVGVGPYQAALWNEVEEVFGSSIADRHHPMPWDDGIDRPWWLDLSGEAYFGFTTAKALKDWFNPRQRAKLERLGMTMAVFDIHDDYVAEGIHQCAFYRPKASLRYRRALTDLRRRVSEPDPHGASHRTIKMAAKMNVFGLPF